MQGAHLPAAASGEFPKRHPLQRLIADAALSMLAGASQATVLNFDTYNSTTHGDRVSGFGLGYGSAGGATPNIVLDFVQQAGSNPFSVYAGGYSGLVNALGHADFDVPGYIQFTPDAGFEVIATHWCSSALAP